MKVCKKCQETKPLSDYYRTKEGYYFGKCKKCHIKNVSEKRDPEKAKEYMKEYRKRPEVRDRKKKATAAWWKSEAGREYNRRRCRKRHQADPEYHNLKRAARAAGCNLSVLLVVKERDEVCQMCGCLDDLQFDHIFPQSLGGMGTEDNLQLLCGDCNAFKCDNLLLPEGGMLILSQDLKERLVGVVPLGIPGS